MKKLIAMSLIACTALSLAACGSTSSDTSAEETTAEETSEETADAASDKVWVIAMDTVFQPFEYTDENGDFVGIDVDIIKAVAEDQGFQIEIQSLGWDAAVAAVQAGQADALLAGASITEERQNNGWIFSDGYYTATQSFVVPSDSEIASFEDLAGKDVAVKNGTEGAKYADSLKDTYGFTVTVYDDSPTMYQAVQNGNSVACVEDTPIMSNYIKNGELDFKIPEGMANEGADYGLAIMDESNQEFLDLFNAGLADIRENGTYDEIIATYLGE